MKIKMESFLAGAFPIILIAVGMLLDASSTAAGPPATVPSPTTEAPAGKGGAQLWSENCAMCHKLIPSSSYSGAEWDVIMLHMRLRANLTPQEQRAILELLRSGS
jgi:cytochrome c5